MALEFKKVDDTEYTVQFDDTIIGYLVRDSVKVWGFLSEKKNLFLLAEELSIIMNKIKDLTFEDKRPK